MNSTNFGYHTLNAIKDDREKGIQIEASFTKYQGLNKYQIEGVTKAATYLGKFFLVGN